MIETDSSRGRRLGAALAVLAAALAPAPGSAQTTCPELTAPIGYAVSGTCGPNAPVGTLCPVTCDSTVGFIGSAVTPICRPDGTWSSLTGCALAICAAPAAPTGYSVSCPDTTWASTCSITCDAAAGYIGTPSSSSTTCLTGGWSVAFSSLSGCQVASCGPFASHTGYVTSCSGTTSGSTCAISCDTAQGFEGAPTSPASVCQLDQRWSVAPGELSGCVLHDCGAPVAPPGYALSCSGTIWGSTCGVACDAASGWVGTPSGLTATCTTSGWSGVSGLSGCALADCGPLTFANADTSNCTAHSRYGESCTVACNAGFEGSPTASCSATGAWSVGGSCGAIACWPSPSTNGESCGGSGETCLGGACAVPMAGQVCALPAALGPDVASSFALDGQHDLLSTGGCTSGVAAGKDAFVRAEVTAGDWVLSVNTTAGSAVQVVVLDGCVAAACAPLDLVPDAGLLTTTVHFAVAETALLAVHVLDPSPATTLAVRLARAPRGAPPPPSGSGSGCTTGAGAGATALLGALALLAIRRRRG